MKTITLNLFEFDELSDKAKEKAREWYRRASDGDSDWSECVINEAIEQGQLLGIDFKMHDVKLHGGGTRQKPCIWWRGFSSQGDGACFEGTWRARNVKADKVAEGWGDAPETTEIKRIAKEFAGLAMLYPDATLKVTHRGHYNHERSVYCDFDSGIEDDDEVASKVAEYGDLANTEESATETARDFMRQIYRRLEKAYEYEQSDECVDENIKANEYTFLENGKRHD